ncbi:MAG: hypothetical protein ACJAUV_001297 [Flavobacteriales bacterium]|jgi:hypothetical protein
MNINHNKLFFVQEQFPTLEEFIYANQLVTGQEFEHMYVGLRKDQIIHILYKPKANLDLACAKEVVSYMGLISNQKPLPNLIELTFGNNITKEATKFSKSEEANKYTLADAILVKSSIHRILGNVYMSLGATLKPTRLFVNQEYALHWLSNFQS